jgi:phosphoglycolate phosphatase
MKNIIFDMDGTLINSGTLIANTINHVRENLDLAPMEKSIVLKHINEPQLNPAMFFYETESFSDEQTVWFEEYYEKHCYTDLELYEGIYDLLDDLSGDYFLSVATNANDHIAKKMLSHTGIEKFFAKVVGANNVPNPKPHPDMLLKIIDEHKLEKHRTILIGDSPKDKLSAQSAGIDSIIVNWGFTDYFEDDVIERVDEIYKKLKSV